MSPKKKDFSSVNTNPVYEAIAEATEQIPGQLNIDIEGNIAEEKPQEDKETRKNKPRKTYTPEETLEALENLKTSGRKGMQAPRINLAFTPSNYEFIKVMAQVRGQNLTEFVNAILDEARTTHADIYEKAIEFKNSL